MRPRVAPFLPAWAPSPLSRRTSATHPPHSHPRAAAGMGAAGHAVAAALSMAVTETCAPDRARDDGLPALCAAVGCWVVRLAQAHLAMEFLSVPVLRVGAPVMVQYQGRSDASPTTPVRGQPGSRRRCAHARVRRACPATPARSRNAGPPAPTAVPSPLPLWGEGVVYAAHARRGTVDVHCRDGARVVGARGAAIRHPTPAVPECLGCMSRPAMAVLTGCRHTPLCKQCVRKWATHGQARLERAVTCPKCRAPSTTLVAFPPLAAEAHDHWGAQAAGWPVGAVTVEALQANVVVI